MTRNIPLDAEKIKNLAIDTENCLKELSTLGAMDLSVFKSDRHNYGLADHFLRRTLENILTIGTHILSRLPVKTKDYQEVITSLGKNNIIPSEFADKNKKLAGYRNRLVHMYWEVSEEELHQVINTHLLDLQKFLEYYEAVLKNPKKFNLPE